MTAVMLELQGVRKVFGRRPVLNDLSLTVRKGEKVALLGHNGAGKSTLLRVVAGLLPYETGRILIAGLPLPDRHQEAKLQFGYLPDVPPMYEALTPLEYIEYIATLWHLPAQTVQTRAGSYLKQYQLWDARHSWIQNLSKGMRQKIGLISVFMRDPPLMLLDEPFSGLDAEAIELTIRELQKLGDDRTLIIASHDLDLVEQVTTRALVLRHGQAVDDFPVVPGRLVVDLEQTAEAAGGGQ